MHPEKQQPYLSSFGRNRGRKLRPHQQQLVEELLPKLNADPKNLPTNFKKIAFEIGFGGGEHLLAQALAYPDTLFIGCEPYQNGVARCLSAIDEAGRPANIRILMQDARKFIDALPDGALDTVFILFPDPWPKARHNKRRLINHQLLEMLHRVQRPGGRLLIATDHIDYSTWICEHLLTTPHYRWTAQSPADFLNPPADWTVTKYQRKTTEQGRAPQFFECVRVA